MQKDDNIESKQAIINFLDEQLKFYKNINLSIEGNDVLKVFSYLEIQHERKIAVGIDSKRTDSLSTREIGILIEYLELEKKSLEKDIQNITMGSKNKTMHEHLKLGNTNAMIRKSHSGIKGTLFDMFDAFSPKKPQALIIKTQGGV